MKNHHRNNVDRIEKNLSVNVPDFRDQIEEFIGRLRFAREMRSVSLWEQSDEAAMNYCKALRDDGHISEFDLCEIYRYIMENAVI